MTSNPLIAYKSNALVEASYKLTLQEQRFLLLCISRLNSGTDVASPELQKTMTITAADSQGRREARGVPLDSVSGTVREGRGESTNHFF